MTKTPDDLFSQLRELGGKSYLDTAKIDQIEALVGTTSTKITARERFSRNIGYATRALNDVRYAAHEILNEQDQEERLRGKYPALQSAWDAYQVVLKMVRENDPSDSEDSDTVSISKLRAQLTTANKKRPSIETYEEDDN